MCYMNKEKKKLLLVWPPMTFTLGLPLGVASLVAYLKNHGVFNTEVLDANGAYLKRNWIYQFKKKYCDWVFKIYSAWEGHAHGDLMADVAGPLENPTKCPGENAGSRFHRKIITVLHGYFMKSLNEKSNRIPSSLPEIEKYISNNSYGAESKVLAGFLQNILKRTNFDLIGFSIFYPEQMFFALFLSKIIKEKFCKETRIVLGGPHITEHVEEFKRGGGLLGLIDFFIEGDGEEPLLQLSKTVSGGVLSGIPNLYIRDSTTRIFHRTQGRFHWDAGYVSMPDFDGFDLGFYMRAAPLLASKGCLWSKCHFCIRPSIQGHRYLTVTPEKVLEIMIQLEQKYGFSNYHFVIRIQYFLRTGLHPI